MTDPKRNHLKKRAERALSKHKTPAPDTLASLRNHKRLAHGKPLEPEPQCDCNGCAKNCGFSTRRCSEACGIGRCNVCGQKTRYRMDPEKTWTTCHNCR